MYQTKYGDFEGDSWEDFCQQCLKIKYKDERYQEIPAHFGGDMGIEGFTRTGKVFQCYCPDENYEQRELYNHQRAKLTKDIGKLEDNKKELMDFLKTIKIKEWIFLTPEFTNKDLVKHCTNKRDELNAKKLEHLDKNFDILVYDIDFFAQEIPIVQGNRKKKISIIKELLPKEEQNEWENSNINEIENTKRKISILADNKNNKEKWIKKRIESTIDDYFVGETVLKEIKHIYTEKYEHILNLKNSYEKEVEKLCDYNEGSNLQLLKEIENKLETILLEQYSDVFEIALILEIKRRIISEWIMKCPIDFIKEV